MFISNRGKIVYLLFIVFIMLGYGCPAAIAAPASATKSIDFSTVIAPTVMTTLLGVLTLILVDTLLGIMLSLKQGRFNLRKLPQFLSTNVLPYIGGLLVLGLAAGSNAQLAAVFYAAAATAGTKYFIEIKDKVILLFGKNTVESRSY